MAFAWIVASGVISAQESDSRPVSSGRRSVSTAVLSAFEQRSPDSHWPSEDAILRLTREIYEAKGPGRFPIPGTDELTSVDFSDVLVDSERLRGVWIKSRGRLAFLKVESDAPRRVRLEIDFSNDASILGVAAEFRDDSRFPDVGFDCEFVGFIYGDSAVNPSGRIRKDPARSRPIVYVVSARPIDTKREKEVRDARNSLANGDYVDARRRFDALRESSADYDALVGGGIAAFHLNLDDQSADELFRANRMRPYEPEPLYYFGLVRDRSGRNDLEAGRTSTGRKSVAEAVEIFRECARRRADPFEVLYWAAEGSFLIERFNDALDDIRVAGNARPDSESAALLELKCLERLSNWRELSDRAVLFRRRFAFNIDAARLETLAGVKLVDEAAVNAAIDAVEAAETSANQWVHLQTLFEGWNQTPQMDALLRILKDLRERKKDDVRPLFYLGLAESYRNRFPEAIRFYDDYLALRPTDALVAARRIQLLRLSGKRADAETSLRKCLAEGTVDDALLAEGQAVVARLVTDKKFSESYELQKLLFDASPNDPTIARGMAVLSKDVGSLDAALAIYDALVARTDLDPSQMAVYKNERGLCLKGLGRFDEAEKSFRDAAAESAIHVDARENLGVFLFDRGRPDAAMAVFEEVLTIEPGRERTMYYLRRCRVPESRPARN